MRPLIVILALAFSLVLVVSGLKPRETVAYPTFAQALGVDCQTCHTMVPELNAYGRYLQRTFYQPINNKQTRNELPFWIWYQAIGNNKGGIDSAQASKKDDLVGVLYLYATGFVGTRIQLSRRKQHRQQRPGDQSKHRPGNDVGRLPRIARR